MQAAYPATFRDRHDEEAATLQNDGKWLQFTVRGVAFAGTQLDDFTPAVPPDDPLLADFTVNRWDENTVELCGCVIEFRMPLPVMTPAGVVEASLNVRVELGLPKEGGGIDREEFVLALHLGGGVYRSSGSSGWLEDELLEVQRALPEGTYLRACINCAFSDYSVYGHGAFGCMFCFRGVKAEYRNVRTKADYFGVMDRYTELVQETYLCPEFEQRRPGTGYRG